MERIVPIYEDRPAKPEVAQIGGTLADLVACILAALASITALGYSIWFFSRFLENDTHLWGIFSAFILCFGIGAFAFIPAAITSRLAWRAYRQGARRKNMLWAIFMLVPWFLLSLVLVFISDLSLIYSLPLLILVILLSLWAIISMSRSTM